jgi:hypothetical protein
MMAPMRSLGVLPALLLLTACGKADNDPGPGGVTVGEARALDEAAEMIEQRRLPAEALRSPAPLPAPTASESTAP